MHAWVVLDKETLKPLQISHPFTFRHHGVEYCVGAQLFGEDVHVFASVWDRESWVGRIPMKECVKMLRSVSSS